MHYGLGRLHRISLLGMWLVNVIGKSRGFAIPTKGDWNSSSILIQSHDDGTFLCAFKNSGQPQQNTFSLNGHSFVSQCRACYAKARVSHLAQDVLDPYEKGCLTDLAADQECQSQRCHVPGKSQTGMVVCCCSGNNCNEQLVLEANQTNNAPMHPSNAISDTPVQIFFAVTCLSLVLILGLVWIIFRLCRDYRAIECQYQNIRLMSDHFPTLLVSKISDPNAEANGMEENCLRNPSDLLEIDRLISTGRFSDIYQGVFRPQPDSKGFKVVAKLIHKRHSQRFNQERWIYDVSQAVRLNKTRFLECYGAYSSITLEGVKYENVLLLGDSQLNTLYSHVKTQTLSWRNLCQIFEDISQALAILHGDSSSLSRIAICHRDLNSKNILIDKSLRCRLANFESSIMFEKGKITAGSQASPGGQTSRYVAPELVEGVVNFRDFETSLKQVDVYALALAFWEVANRCQDLFQGTQVPSYQFAYEREIGPDPSLDQMQIMVAKNKVRPLFPNIWKRSNPGVQLLKETIIYCWDDDADARLTTLGVVERINEMRSLWDRYQQGMSLEAKSGGGFSPSISNNSSLSSLERTRNAFNTVFHSNEITPPPRSVSSEAFTSAASPLVKNDNVTNRQQIMGPIQPHQGLNPCQERNMNRFVPQIEAPTKLVLASAKHTPKRAMQVNNERIGHLGSNPGLGLFPLLLPNHHPQQPIPMVQNDLHTGSSSPARPNLGTPPCNGKIKNRLNPTKSSNLRPTH